jgi:ribonuclease-3
LTLLNHALTHSSYGHEKNLPDNERLEFLGDAILKLAISEYIFNKYPEKAEGDLTKIRAAVISDETLANVGRQLTLGDFLLMSENEKKTGGSRRKSNLANTLEALIGAIYLDAGLGKARDLIVEMLRTEIELNARSGYIRDYKSALQEYSQKRKWELPHYKVIKESGPKHRRVFWMEVKVHGKWYGVGRGGNKKEAEQRAAMQALRKLKEKKETPSLRGILSSVRKRIKL